MLNSLQSMPKVEPLTMDNSPAKRRRLVKTCTECYRRKQKCNRKKPCDICVLRKVPEKCSYEDSPTSRAAEVAPESFKSLNDHHYEQPKEQDLATQVGYSSKTDSNALIGLKKSLHGTDEAASLSNSPHSLSITSADKLRALVGLLPQFADVHELVEVFFSEANWYFQALERYYFNILYNSWVLTNKDASKIGLEQFPHEGQCFQALLFQVLAVALQFLPPGTVVSKNLNLQDYAACDRLSEQYSNAGVEIMRLLGRYKPTLTSVQADLMRAVWLKNCSRGTESWYSMGDAIRQAQDLGLHLQSHVPQSAGGNIEETLSRLWFDEYRRRQWVTLFTWDIHMAMILGRPRTINAGDCTIRPPTDCDIPEDPAKIVPTPAGPDDPPAYFSEKLCQYSLALKGHEILTQGANKRHLKDYGVVQTIHDQITSLLDDLPPAHRPENPDTSWDVKFPHLPAKRQHIKSAANSFLMGLHRSNVAVYEASRKAAIQAALNILEAQERLFGLVSQHHYKIYTLSFYSIDAGMFLCAMLIEHPPQDQQLSERIQFSLCQAIIRLTLMENRNAMARSGLQVLKACYQKIYLSSQIGTNFNQSSNAAYMQIRTSDSTQQDAANTFQDHVGSLGAHQSFDLSGQSDVYRSVAQSYTMPSGDWQSLGLNTFNPTSSSAFTSSWPAESQMVDLDPTLPINSTNWSSLLG